MTLEEAEREYRLAQEVHDWARRREREWLEIVEALRAADARERARERRAIRRLGFEVRESGEGRAA